MTALKHELRHRILDALNGLRAPPTQQEQNAGDLLAALPEGWRIILTLRNGERVALDFTPLENDEQIAALWDGRTDWSETFEEFE